MIEILLIFISYFIPWCTGYLLLSLIDKKKILSFGFKFFAAFLIGIGVLTYEMFLIGIAGIKENSINLLALNFINIIILEVFSYFFQKKIIYPSFSKIFKGIRKIWIDFQQMIGIDKILMTVLLLTILFRVGMGIWQVSLSPSFDFDAWNNWNLRAKVIFTEQKIPLDRELRFFLGGGIKSYPMNNVLWKVWLASMLGRWDDQKINSFSVILYLILLGLFYFSFSSETNRRFKILGTYLLSSLPFLWFHSWVAYADLQLSLYLFFTVVALIKFLAAKEKLYLYLSAFGLAMTVWTKNEGLVLVTTALFLFSLIISMTKTWRIKDFVIYWLTSGLILSPWLIFRSIYNLGALSGDSSFFRFVFHYEFFNDWFSKIFWQSHFNFIWWLIFFIFLLKFKLIINNFKLKNLFLILLILFLVYNSVFLLTNQSWGLNAETRAILHLVPLAVFLVMKFLNIYFYDIRKGDLA